MTRRRLLIALAVLAVLGVGGILLGRGGSSTDSSPPRAFCRAAERYEQVIQRGSALDVDRQIELVAEIAATAPRAIEGDAQTFLDALRRVEDDPSVRDDPRIEEAVENVNRYAAQGCGAYTRSRG